jgi:hypothetical protein
MFMFDKKDSQSWIGWSPKKPYLIRLAAIILWIGIALIIALIWLALFIPNMFFVPAIFLVPVLLILVPITFVWVHQKGQFG